MRPQLIMFCYAVCIVGTMYSLISSGVWFSANETDFINALAGISAVQAQTMGGMNIPQTPFDWLNAVVTMVSWNYPYLNGAWGAILKMIIFYPCTIGVMWTVWEMFTMVLQGLAGMVRSLIP